ncbi:hypothetical protein ROZALSC1DRAFT_22206 [Rozella allomycis CSF55]|uniref:Uncharacterized protein n=1 Tax=Rozella allomycis (strain CSF55) TaxID=988480 RepID=A0A4V1IZX1_ROZAC|nr:hypothetical protein ROZALSC1DRAFT_22206 [Rozella allomycis CSF55]
MYQATPHAHFFTTLVSATFFESEDAYSSSQESDISSTYSGLSTTTSESVDDIAEHKPITLEEIHQLGIFPNLYNHLVSCKYGNSLTKMDSTIVNKSHLDVVMREMNNIDILNFVEINIKYGQDKRSAWTVRELHCKLADYFAQNISFNSITDAYFMETLKEFIYRLQNASIPDLNLGPTQISESELLDPKKSFCLKDYTSKFIKFEMLENVFNMIAVTSSTPDARDLTLIRNFFQWLRHFVSVLSILGYYES